jgi:galactokinase
VNLLGEHTDYSGGLVLPAAIDRYVTLAAQTVDGVITLDSGGFGVIEVAADGSRPPADGWGRYVAAVAAELADLGRAPVGLRGTVASDLPAGAGLSSSAALEVAVGLALCAVGGLELEPLVLAQALQRAERRAVGVPTGIMDQAASLLGRARHAVLLDCGTLEHRLVPLPAGLALVIIDSGVSRELSSSGYAARRAQLEEALDAIGEDRTAGLDPDDALARARAAGVGPVALRRLRHVVTENARVRAAEAALTAPEPDLATLGRLFAEGHASLRDDFEVTTPELDLLVELAVEAGAVAARMTGGGFGGAIIALVEQERADDLGQRVAAEYGRRADRTATVHRCVAADGAQNS